MRHYYPGRIKRPDVLIDKKNRCQNIICLDIETTSVWRDDDGTPVGYVDDLTEDWLNSRERKAFTYIWMVGVDNVIYYGRYMKNLLRCLKEVRDKIVGASTILWVHNLGYEFQFLSEYIQYEQVFARSVRKPIKCEALGFEWRCTYALTNMSLATWGHSLGCPKRTGDLDYKIVRTPLTPLKRKEYGYCSRDIEVMFSGLRKKRDQWGSLQDIPLTKTGELRHRLKKECPVGWKKKYTSMLPHTAEEYTLLRSIFAGGSTGCPRCNADMIHKDVGSWDLTSDYSSQMVYQKYPTERFRPYDGDTMADRDRYAYIVCVRISDISPKGCIEYLSSSRVLRSKNARYANGKLYTADWVICSLCDVDIDIVQMVYDCTIEVIQLFRAKKQLLPNWLIEILLDAYASKTTLKGVPDMDAEYMAGKEVINAMYGVQVTDLINTNVFYKNGVWSDSAHFEDGQKKSYRDRLNEITYALYEKHEKWWKNITSYSTGVWITAYARLELWSMLTVVDQMTPDWITDLVYWDTDSCKLKNWKKYQMLFEKRNAQITAKIRKALEDRGIDPDRSAPCTQNGDPKPLGVWDTEKPYDRFITLGAKKYAYEQNGHIGITVSGVPKDCANDLPDLESFRDGFEFSKNSRYAKNLVTYVDDSTWCPTFPDGFAATNKRSIVIRPTSYRLGMTDDYSALVKMARDKQFL